MKVDKSCVLAVNGGSSSLKFALYRGHDVTRELIRGGIDRIGSAVTTLSATYSLTRQRDARELGQLDYAGAARVLLDYLEERVGLAAITAVGHRVVNGGDRYFAPQRISGEMLAALRRVSAYTPDHLPAEIALIESIGERLASVPQVACFDTAFHRNLPRVAKRYALPRRLQAAGLERRGFHGLSYAFLLEELARLAGTAAARGRVILAHLGNGASLAAVREGRSVDTSMGFTPAAGVPMSTRSGDVDPGIVLYLTQTEGLSAAQFHRMVNHESGLLGVSETTSDVRDLLAREANDERAADALALFCYQVRKWIGAYAAALGGVDRVVFAGGIGENAAVIRARICDGLAFLGIELDADRNAAGAPIISRDGGRVEIRIIRTDEEVMIAKGVLAVLDAPPRERSDSRDDHE